MKIQKNIRGFAVIETLLIFTIIVVIGAVGWYVWKNNKKTDTTQLPLETTKVENKTAEVNTTKGWVSYTSTSGKYTLMHPATWVTATNPELCADGIFMLGANTSSVGKCGSSDFGQITVTWRHDRQFCGDLNPDAWTTTSKEDVTIAGTQGIKLAATAKIPRSGMGTVPEGTKDVQYCVVANNTTYILNYTQLANYTDALNDFDLMATKTFKIN